MMCKLNIIIMMSCGLFWGTVVYAQKEKDPFVPFLFESPKPAATAEDTSKDMHSTVRPLNTEPLKSYRLIGLIASENTSIAVIQTTDRREYMVTIGDLLGKEGGVIEAIDSDGIAVDKGDEIVRLRVTNKFELQNDKR